MIGLNPACPDEGRLRQLLDESLPPPDQDDLTAHLDGCRHCQQRLEALVAGNESWVAARGLRDGAATDTMAPDLRRAVEELGRGAADTGEGHASAADDTEALAFLAPPRQPGNLGRLEHYEILESVGRGGMGVVLKGFDEKLHRVVAIKALAPHLRGSTAARRRFVREARAAAAVAHEHVVAIHAVADEGPVPYLVMQYVAGASLEDRLREGGPLEVEEVVRLGVEIAAGLAAAHAQGLVHRDVKPANILLENVGHVSNVPGSGTTRVKITDFGLARAHDDPGLTQDGVIAGTPLYMSPEQARGEPVDARSDLFSLGSVLYALCTGRPPFRASNTMAVLRRVCEDTPQPVAELNPAVPVWLSAVVDRLLAKEPEARFQSAEEVADALRRHRAPPERTGTFPSLPRSPAAWPRRRRTLIALAAAAGLAAFLLVPWGADPERLSPGGPDGRNDSAPRGPGDGPIAKDADAEGTALDRLKREEIPLALLALAGAGDPTKAPAELVAVLADPRFLMPGGGPTSWPAQTRDGKLLAVPCGHGVALFEARSGALLRVLGGHKGRVFSVAFHPSANFTEASARMPGALAGELAAATRDAEHTITLWDLGTGKPTRTLRGHSEAVLRVAYNSSGNLLASSSDDGTVKLWDTARAVAKLSLEGHTDNVGIVAFTPRDRYVVSGSRDGTVRVWKSGMGGAHRTLRGHKGNLSAIAFSPDGKWMATGSNKEARIWDAETFAELHTLAGPAVWLAFAQDGRTVLTAAHDHPTGTAHEVLRWDAATGKALKPLPLSAADGSAVYHLSHDGKTLFAMRSQPPEQRLRAYDAVTGRERSPQQGHAGVVYSVAVSPDGKLLASGGADRSVRLWDLTALRGSLAPPVVVRRPHKADVFSVAFSPDGRLLASGSLDQRIALWDVAARQEAGSLSVHSWKPSLIAFTPDGAVLFGGGDDGTVRAWDVAGRREKARLAWHRGAVRAVAVSPNGEVVASAGFDRKVRVAAAKAFDKPQLFATGAPVNAVAFSPDGKRIAAVADAPDTLLRVWDLATEKETQFAGHKNNVNSVAFHPQGHLIATAGSDGTVRLWDATAGGGGPVHTWGPGPFGLVVQQAVFTPEGRHLAVANANATVYLLRLPAALSRKNTTSR